MSMTNFPFSLRFQQCLYLLCVYFLPAVTYFAFAIFCTGSSLLLRYFVKELCMMLDGNAVFWAFIVFWKSEQIDPKRRDGENRRIIWRVIVRSGYVSHWERSACNVRRPSHFEKQPQLTHNRSGNLR